MDNQAAENPTKIRLEVSKKNSLPVVKTRFPSDSSDPSSLISILQRALNSGYDVEVKVDIKINNEDADVATIMSHDGSVVRE